MDPSVDLCSISAGVAPDGSLPNFENPETLGPTVIAVSVVLCVISTVLAAGRLYANWNKMHSADWFTLVAAIFNIGYTGIICAQHRIYRHAWDVPVCWYTAEALQMAFAQTTLFTPAFFFPKAAIFLLYRQLFGINRQTRMAVDFGLFITFLTYLSNIPMAAIYSAPRVGQSWDDLLLTIADDSRPLGIAGITQSAVGTLIDFYIFFLPLPSLLRLHLPKKRVLGLVSIFSTALLGVAASVVSLVFKIQILSSTDSTWLAALTSITSLIETNIAIIVGCMPAFASFMTITVGGSSLFKSLRSRLLGSRGRSTKSKGSSGSGRTGDQATPAGVGYGERQTPRRDTYYKLGDTTLIASQAPYGTSGDAAGEEYEMDSNPKNRYRDADQLERG